MKKMLIGLLFVSGIASAACNGPNFCWDDSGPEIRGSLTSPLGMPSKTLAQMNALTPLAAGQMLYVSDAVQSRICVSSGTTTGGYVVAVASGGFTGSSFPHCN